MIPAISPARFAPVLFGFVLSLMMSLLVSGIATFRAVGPVDGLFKLWLGTWAPSWAPSWAIAFPVVLIVAPVARRIVGGLVRP